MPGGVLELVQVLTIDHFCVSKNIDRIDLLKIDTEGYDLTVLRGGNRMLSERHVRCVLVEAAPNDNDARFIGLDRFQHELWSYDFELFGIYDQMPRLNGGQALGYFNAAFIQSELIK